MMKWIPSLIAPLALFLAGCGGAGDAGPTGGSLNLFVTDNLGDHEQVWVRLHTVQLVSATGDVTLFQNDEGEIMDLRSLRDNGGSLFEFLTRATVATGTYTGVRVVLDKDATLFPTAGAGLVREFAGSVAGKKTLTMAFAAPRALGAGGESVVIDFDLSEWDDDGAMVTGAVIRDHDGQGLNVAGRHVRGALRGTVTSLSGQAPNYAFNLRISDTRFIPIRTNAQTRLFNKSGQPNPLLVNAKSVEVTGRFNPVTATFDADTIEIRDDGQDGEARARGTVVSIDGASFVVAIERARGFLPTQANLDVATTATTRFFLGNGVSVSATRFFENLEVGAEVHVEGSLSGNVLTAAKAKLRDENEDEAEVEGVVSQAQAGAGTFFVAASRWEGLNIGLNHSVLVQTNESTAFFDREGTEISSAQFFAALASGTRASAKGVASFSGNQVTLTAVRVVLKNAQGNQGEVEGPVTAVNAQNRTLTLRAEEWENVTLANGQSVQVVTNAGTTYRDINGDTVTAAQFFGALQVGERAKATGQLSGSVLTATRLRMRD
jgi:hypothetical protein